MAKLEILQADYKTLSRTVIPKGTDIIAKINSVLFTKYNYHPTKDEFEQIKNYIKEHKHSSTH